MKITTRSSAAVIVALTIGYVVGSLRGSWYAHLYERINWLRYAYAIVQIERTGKSDFEFPEPYVIVKNLHWTIAGQPLMHRSWVIPAFVWHGDPPLPGLAFGFDEKQKALVSDIGHFLADPANASNKVTTANGASPRR